MAHKFTITEEDYILANRRASRREELDRHGRPVSYRATHRPKTAYRRERFRWNEQGEEW